MIMNIPPLSELREQDMATLHSYMHYLQSEIARTQAVLQEHNWDGQAAFPELSPKPATPTGIATQAHLQETIYRTIVDNQLDPICRFQADFRLTFVNHPFAALHGKTPQELIDQNLLNLVPPKDRQHLIDQVAVLNAQHPTAIDKIAIPLADGSVRWFQWSNCFLAHVDGTIEYQGVGRDITLLKQEKETEQKQRQLAEALCDNLTDSLRQQRDFLQSVIDHIPGVITVRNQQRKFQLANKYMAQRFGMIPVTLVGKTSREVNPNQDEVKGLHQAEDQVFVTQQPLFIPEYLIGGCYYQVNMLPLPGPTPADDLVLVVATDITERKEAEAALQKALQTEKELSKLKSGFITNTSHAFRTPLAIILSMAETLLSYSHKLANAQIEQRLMRIVGQVQHMKALLENVLELSSMQAQRGNFTPAQCDPAVLCRKLMTELQNHLGTTRQLLYASDVGLPMANLDENLLHHILNHLISNAMKYSAADKPVVVHLASRNDALVLMVRDEGMGIPAAEIQHLFQPFYRATNVGPIPGTGLGLSIIKEAVELHRGSIAVESQVGVGSTFTVTFPLTANA